MLGQRIAFCTARFAVRASKRRAMIPTASTIRKYNHMRPMKNIALTFLGHNTTIAVPSPSHSRKNSKAASGTREQTTASIFTAEGKLSTERPSPTRILTITPKMSIITKMPAKPR